VPGSAGVAAWIAHALFWGLLVFGWVWGQLNLKRIALFLLLWLAGLVGLGYIPDSPVAAMFSSFVAMLDIALVFVIFKGDVRLT
jgi:hypothetical protein